MAEGHLIEPSTPWLPPALDRDRWQLDLAQGAPLLTHLLQPEPQLTEHCVPSRRQGSSRCLAGWRPRGPSSGLPQPRARLPAASCHLVSGFLPPAANTHTLAADRARSCPRFSGPSCPVPEAPAFLWFTRWARKVGGCGESLCAEPHALSPEGQHRAELASGVPRAWPELGSLWTELHGLADGGLLPSLEGA